MKSLDKINNINNIIKNINNTILIHKTWKIVFDNTRGSNNYLLRLEDNGVVVKGSEKKFNTYDDITNCIVLFELMFSKGLNEKKEGKL